MDFAIDQQQYLQGCLPIVFLTYYKLYGLMPGGGRADPDGPRRRRQDERRHGPGQHGHDSLKRS
jgi:simple sugar transport system substrate-binding protein